MRWLSSALGSALFLQSGHADLLQLAPREELALLIKTQEHTINRLQSMVNELSAERSYLQQQVKLLNSTGASAGSVAAATHSALKAEVRRLLHRTQGHNRGQDGEEHAEGSTDGSQSEDTPWSHPQQISLACKGEAEVDIRPLQADDRVNGECMVLRVQAQEVAARFVLYCDGLEEDEEGQDSEGGGTNSDHA